MQHDSSLSAHTCPVSERKHIPLRLYFILLVVGWTAAIGISLWYNSARLTAHALDSAKTQARTALDKDIVYRQWNSSHGGVYVPVIPGKLEPNPYLPEKDREIVATNGRVYTKINPSYMTRLVHNIGELRLGMKGHITSNLPLRKENAPDDWERDVLAQFEDRKTDEVSAVFGTGDQQFVRLMRCLDTEPSCMPCHAAQGYKVGDVRGGISILVPLTPFLATMSDSRHTLLASHIALWGVGVLGLAFGHRAIARRLRERDKAEAELRDFMSLLESRVQERTADLKSRQSELHAFVRNANAGVFLKKHDGIYRVVNARFAAILGRSVAAITGRKDEEILAPSTAMALRAHERKVLASGLAAELKNAFVSVDGTHYSCFTFPVMEDSVVTGLGGLVVDMTERDHTERVLRDARDAAEKANRAKTDFLANMSHEIRTPLNGVIGMADLLLRTQLTPDQASMAAAIKASGDSLLLVLNDVLDISKIEAGKFTIEIIPFDLRDVLFDAIKGLTPIAYKKGVELILHISPSVPEIVKGDPVRLRQVILNLVNNALKFTEQGEVVVTVAPLDEPGEALRLRFSVTDTGIGIPLEKQRHIFDAFEQVDTSTTRKYGGTGLGLTICDRLLKLMGTALELKSHEGFGSSFWFDLDVSVVDSNVAKGKRPVGSEALHGISVLIVDDNDTNLRVLHETLKGWGMLVQESRSAEEAFRLAKAAVASAQPYALLLSDVHMPGNGGVDLARMIRADEELAALPMLLLSSGTLPVGADRENGRDLFSGVLDKPVRPEALMHAIATALHIWEIYTPKEIQHEEDSAGHDSTCRNLRVLLVEDVEMNRMVATRMLKELGHEVTVVSDGKQAIDAVMSERFDLVLMDIQMPVMDGVQATLAIREMERQGAIPYTTTIVAMTANALKGDRDKYLDAGMDNYLAKPILLDELRTCIQETLHPTADDDSSATPSVSWRTAVHTTRFFDAPAREGEPSEPEQESVEPCSSFPESGIDWDLVNKSFAGNEEFILDSVNLYLRDAPVLIGDMQAALQRMDNDGFAVTAHSLKVITRYFTRGQAYALCVQLEEAGRHNGLPDRMEQVNKAFSMLRGYVDQLIDAMKEYVNRVNTQ